MSWGLERECLGWAGRTCAGGAVFETNAETGLFHTREIGNEDGSGIPGVPVCVLVPGGSADDCTRVMRPASTREFGYKLIQGEAVGYGLNRPSQWEGDYMCFIRYSDEWFSWQNTIIYYRHKISGFCKGQSYNGQGLLSSLIMNLLLEEPRLH